jgi:hypothetical protein
MTVDDPRHVAKVANRSGPLAPDDIEDLASRIAAAFPPAVSLAVASGPIRRPSATSGASALEAEPIIR